MADASQQIAVPDNQCEACGSPLNPALYFCTTCAKPWRDPSIGLGPVPEPVWDPETRIRLRSPEAEAVDAELAKALRVNRYVHVNFYDFRGELVTDRDGQVIAPALSVAALIKSPNAEVEIRLPSGVPVGRIVLLP